MSLDAGAHHDGAPAGPGGGPTPRGAGPHGRRLVRTPSGELVEEPPLDASLGELQPFHRPEAAAPAPPWVGPVFLGLGALLVPWMVVLAVTLPGHEVAAHYRATWVGFDCMLAVALALTGWFAARRSTWIEVSASVAATLLVVDAWFDVLTAGTRWDRIGAVAEALLVELPLAAVSVWIARHAAEVNERTALFLLTRSQRQAARLRAEEDAHAAPPAP